MKLKKLPAAVYDVTFRCHSCKILMLLRATWSEPIFFIKEDELARKAPKCPECGKKTTYYWAAGWAKDPSKDA